jgi:uncharacterized membrane protein YccC
MEYIIIGTLIALGIVGLVWTLLTLDELEDIFDHALGDQPRIPDEMRPNHPGGGDDPSASHGREL